MTPRAAPRPSELCTWQDWRVDDCRGLRVGALAEVYEDLAQAVPVWFLVRLSDYSARFALAPPAEVLAWHGRICLPYHRERVESAPPLYSPPDEVGPGLEAQLRHHYGLESGSGVHMNIRRAPA